MELKKVVFALEGKWDDPVKELEEKLSDAGITCVRRPEERMNILRTDDAGLDRTSTLLMTDDRGFAVKAAERGFVCVGCACGDDAYFEGAALVTDDPSSLDARLLNLCLLHAQKRPATIAETKRLLIREIAEQDFEELYRISRQDGMRYLQEDISCFAPERLAAYIRYAYRFYGFGLWSVLRKDGTLIGCCGLTECAEQTRDGREHADEKDGTPRTRLELQYMVTGEYQGQGYGEEMCRAAIAYARAETDRDTVWLRIHPENTASLRLAEKLGFKYRGTEPGDPQRTVCLFALAF